MSEYNDVVYELLRRGRDMVQNTLAHVSHGGPTREEAEKWVQEATDALKEPSAAPLGREGEE